MWQTNCTIRTHSNDYNSDTKQQISHSASQNCRKESRAGELTLYSHPHSSTLRPPTTHTSLTVGLSNPADNDTSDRSKFSLSGPKRENTLTIHHVQQCDLATHTWGILKHLV